MDTSKYRLPDETNGNGTKAQLDTRREHIERQAPSFPREGDSPPPPPPKDSPPAGVGSDFVPGLASYFTPGHQRPGSIYTLSRASFASQLAQLTSLQLPDAESLSSKISAIQTAQAAARALINAADQIKSWISKASEVISGLDSDDDVEWAAAGGREGLAEVEGAIVRFEQLIKVYVGAIEELQCRPDISAVDSDDLRRAVSQMDTIVTEWSKIRATLRSVKVQVELAMEWEELWNVVLGDIQNEKDDLSRLVFEMEERRHKSLMAAAATGDGVDIGDLETIVDDAPPRATKPQAQNRFSLPPFPLSPVSPTTPTMSQDDSSLLALFARMQPLRASLDFLPMRLSVFEARAQDTFPTACEELEERRAGLDGAYKKLEADAESLRKELGEDRWVLVFRGAGRQAQKMCESVERAVLKLKEAVDAGMHLTNQPVMGKKIESYEAKKIHYGPAIERIIGIIDKGVKDRLTVNGEILRLHGEVQARWDNLKQQINEVDMVLDELHADQFGQQLRDSVSSMLSIDRSTIASGNETPGSSPPSSVIMPALGFGPVTPKGSSVRLGGHLSQTASSSRRATVTTPSSKIPQKPTPSRFSKAIHEKPWNNYATNPSKAAIATGHIFPSPSASSPALRSPVSETPDLPDIDLTPSKRSGSRMSLRGTKVGQQTLAKTRLAASALGATTRRASSILPMKDDEDEKAPARPASSLAIGGVRRQSLLPQPKSKESGFAAAGRESPALAGARHAMRQSSSALASSKDTPNKPRWRY